MHAECVRFADLVFNCAAITPVRVTSVTERLKEINSIVVTSVADARLSRGVNLDIGVHGFLDNSLSVICATDRLIPADPGLGSSRNSCRYPARARALALQREEDDRMLLARDFRAGP
ncbi:MAG: hypothetical protein ACI915_003521 [Gammaproteobacteria bacterium]|jgi:hypothetical protein